MKVWIYKSNVIAVSLWDARQALVKSKKSMRNTSSYGYHTLLCKAKDVLQHVVVCCGFGGDVKEMLCVREEVR